MPCFLAWKKMKLNVYDIVVTVEGIYSGSITCSPDLYETCPKCGEKNCLYQCDGSHLGQVQTEDEVAGRIQGNAAIDAIMSIILAHAIGGINVESPAYLEGIETAVEAIGNNV